MRCAARVVIQDQRSMSPHRPTAISTLLGLILTAEMSGCLYSPFFRSDGPSQFQGVSVSLARQRCSFEPPWSRPDQSRGYIDLWMRLRIRNDSPQIVTIDPQKMRLIEGTFVVDKPETGGQIHRLAPAEMENVDLRFRKQADFGCNAQMSLSLDQSIRVGPRLIPLRAVTFVADVREEDDYGGSTLVPAEPVFVESY